MSIILKKTKLIKILFFLIAFLSSLLFVDFSQAASLYFSPNNPSFRVGDTFQIGVFVSSPDEAINAAQATISFPTDKLNLISVSTKNSIFSLMVENPTFSNIKGTASFSGIVLNPGYTGKNGRLVTLNFLAKQTGKATLNINSAQVLANDGVGTNILTSRGTTNITILEKIKEEKPSEKPETKPSADIETIIPTSTLTTTIVYVTTTQYIITTTACFYDFDKLPVVYLKIGGLSTGPSFLLLVLLILSALITIYTFYKGFTYPEKKKHRLLGRKK